jgi:tetratricopeptide (TPR) repeat protein
VLAEALLTKGASLHLRGRVNEAQGLIARALQLALEHDLASAALRAYSNLAFLLSSRDRHDAALDQLEQGLAMAHKVGNRPWELQLLDSLVDSLLALGRWDEAVARAAGISEAEMAGGGVMAPVTSLPEMHAHRGELERAEWLLERGAGFRDTADLQDRAAWWAARAAVLGVRGHHAEALEAAGVALGARDRLGFDAQGVKFGLIAATEAALALGDLDRAEELVAVVERLRPGERSPFLHAQAGRFRARLGAAGRGRPDRVEPGFKAAAGLLRELSMHFWLGVVLLEQAEWLTAQDREADAAPLLDEAGAVFERLGARPWSERVGRGAGRPAQARS